MRTAIAILTFLVPSSVAFGGTVELLPSKDNTLYQTVNGSLSNGAGVSIFSGRTAMGPDRRAVLAFDLDGVVPAGHIVTGATLRLYMAQTIVGATPISAHALLADWGEGTSNAMDGNGGGGTASQPGDATWIHTFFPDAFWENEGGDFVPDASATTTVGGLGFYDWTSDALLADVNAWLADPGSNFGWIMINNAGGVPTAKRFSSREEDEFFAPKLILDIEIDPCPTDLDGSGSTDSTDLNIVLSSFGCVGGGCTGDIDGDGDTDSADLNALLAAFGDACP